MIKNKKKKKIDKKQELKQALLGYARTALIAFSIGALFAFLLSFHARSEMIKNLYANKEDRARCYFS